MKEWKSAGLRDRIKLVVFSLVPVIILLAGVELLAGAIIHRTPVTATDAATGAATYSMKIGRFPWSPVSVTPLNSLGFPDVEFAGIVKGDCLHIVFSGDSFTFGDAVDREKNWVSLVRKGIAERAPDRCVRVFNIAERMTTIEQQAARIRETMEVLRPDIVILGQYQNDLTDLTNPGSIAYRPPTEGQKTNYWGDVLRTSVPGFSNSLVRLLTYRTFAFMIQQDMTYEAPLARWSILADTTGRGEEVRWLTGIYRDMYGALRDELREKGVGFGVVIMPSKLDVLARRYPEGEFFLEIAREHAVPYLDVTPVLFDRRERYTYQMYDGHLSEYGNQIVAEEVLRWLRETKQVPIEAIAGPAS